ncbi:MAG: type II toxin-antitoxin system VapC family toxin [Nocardioidaceae bacterium]
MTSTSTPTRTTATGTARAAAAGHPCTALVAGRRHAAVCPSQGVDHRSSLPDLGLLDQRCRDRDQVAVGKLTIPVDFLDHVGPAGFRDLPFTHTDAEALRALPLHHRDPFDQMLIVQARAEGLTLLSSDPRFPLYEVNVLAAS